MIHLEGIRHQYDGHTVLTLPHFEARQGEHWLVLGLSGSGKTTLLHLVAGLHRPTEGQVVVADQDLVGLEGDALDRFRGRNIGVVFQKLHLFETLTVRQNLLMAQFMAGLPQEEARVHEVLGRLDVPEMADRYPATLSQGQRQRVVIARAVLNRPRVLLADEPTSSLDDVRSLQVLDLLTAEAREAGATLLIATHDSRIRDRMPHQLRLDQSAPQPA